MGKFYVFLASLMIVQFAQAQTFSIQGRDIKGYKCSVTIAVSNDKRTVKILNASDFAVDQENTYEDGSHPEGWGWVGGIEEGLNKYFAGHTLTIESGFWGSAGSTAKVGNMKLDAIGGFEQPTGLRFERITSHRSADGRVVFSRNHGACVR